MLLSVRAARRVATLSLAALSLGLAGCSNTEDAEEVEVDFMRITLGSQEALVNSTGAVSGALSVSNGVATPVTVEFLNAAMADALAARADDFQVQVTPGSGLTFTRTGPFSGTITGSLTGARSASFALLHIEENHEDFGPFPVTITVTAPAAR